MTFAAYYITLMRRICRHMALCYALPFGMVRQGALVMIIRIL